MRRTSRDAAFRARRARAGAHSNRQLHGERPLPAQGTHQKSLAPSSIHFWIVMRFESVSSMNCPPVWLLPEEHNSCGQHSNALLGTELRSGGELPSEDRSTNAMAARAVWLASGAKHVGVGCVMSQIVAWVVPLSSAL